MASAKEVEQNGCKALQLTHDSGSTAEVYVPGGHLTSWKTPTGESGAMVEQIFVSSATKYLPDKPIRGGVPVCFPQFGSYGPGGKHGFARNSDKWTVDTPETDADGNVIAVLTLIGDGTESEKWPHPFKLTLRIELSAFGLQMGAKMYRHGSPFAIHALNGRC